VKSFEIIRDCKLVVSKDPTDDNLKEFGKAMNNAIPDQTNQISFMIYKFMRGMYLSDKQKFLDHIQNMKHYESMILWADYDDILKFFELNGVIFLGWNKSVNKYQAAKIDLSKNKNTNDNKHLKYIEKLQSYDQSLDKQIQHLSKAPITTQEKISQQIKLLEKSDDVYDVLLSRVAALQKSN
jgi:hypothetical protein